MKKISALCICLVSFVHAKSDLGSFFTQGYFDALAGKWGILESVSGPGSTLAQTKAIRAYLETLIRQFNIKSIIDAPCGDFNWMQHVNLSDCSYLGIDIIEPLIESNNTKHQRSNRFFKALDLRFEECPYADLIFCRDLLVHLSDEDVIKVLKNFKRNGAKYLLTTTFTSRSNYNITSGGWRPINLQQPPFNFPKAELMLSEHCTEQNGIYADKSLGLWKLEDIHI